MAVPHSSPLGPCTAWPWLRRVAASGCPAWALAVAVVLLELALPRALPAQLGAATSGFSGSVPAFCRIEPPPPAVDLSLSGASLVGLSAPFALQANTRVQLRLGRIHLLQWPAQLGPQPPAVAAAAQLLGSGPYRVRLELQPEPGRLLPPGHYRAAIDLDCIESAA